MDRPTSLTVLGKRWRIRYVPYLGKDKNGGNNRGDCAHPDYPQKTIRIKQNLCGEELVEILIHEMIHAANWHLDEDWIERFAADAARTLKHFGLIQGD
jgi:hypothetical protein